jgi:metal-sulfur cluster biosynthetic enzyme
MSDAEGPGPGSERGDRAGPGTTSEDPDADDLPERTDDLSDGADSGPRYCGYTDYESGTPHPDLPRTGEGASGIEARVWDALYEVEDPEMPVSVVDLGLVYGVYVDSVSGEARVDMTLTYTGCPARDYLLSTVERAVAGVDGVDDVLVNLMWSPAWSVEMVTADGRAALREFGVSI